jgi:hypothetical protein
MLTRGMNGVLPWPNESDHTTPSHEYDVKQVLDCDLLGRTKARRWEGDRTHFNFTNWH